jgi:hypothetical protein
LPHSPYQGTRKIFDPGVPAPRAGAIQENRRSWCADGLLFKAAAAGYCYFGGGLPLVSGGGVVDPLELDEPLLELESGGIVEELLLL